MLKPPSLRVVKVGGNELDRPGWLDRLAHALQDAGPVVIVHGGGRAISALSARLGLPVEKRDGLRVTSPDVVKVVEMVLAGPVSRAIVAALRGAGIDAVGVSGVDGGLLAAACYDEKLGAVGKIASVRPDLLTALLIAGFTPVVAPVAPETAGEGGGGGTLLNVNADDAAAAIAIALTARELLFVSDVPGVELDGVSAAEMTPADIEASIGRGSVTGGMAAKLRAAAVALGSGIGRVRIGGLDMLASAAAGTRLVPASLNAPVPA